MGTTGESVSERDEFHYEEGKMLKWLKLAMAVGVLAALVLGSGATVSAGDDSHIFGLVYIDSNLNGVWDEGEEGYPGKWQEYWDADEEEWVRHYLGTPISFFAGDEENIITLRTAGARSLAEGEQDLCHYQDYLTADGLDDDEDMDVNAQPIRPCSGTYGLRPAGSDGMVWRVSLTSPDGYAVTSPNPVYYEVGKDTGTVDFGIAPASAGTLVKFYQTDLYCEGRFLETRDGVVHEWRNNPECNPYASAGMAETSLHLVFKPASKFATTECDSDGWSFAVPYEWTLNANYVDIGGDEADLRDFLGQDDEQFWWVCMYKWGGDG